jgi:hypothetical protein
MPPRSLQRLPPRSPLRSPDRSTPSLARRLAGRAGWRHGHPLPTMRGDKAGLTAETGAVCPVPEDTMTEKSGRPPRPPPHTRRSQRRPGRRRGARSSRCLPDLPAPAANPLSSPRFPRLMSLGSRSRIAGFWSCHGRDLAGSKLVSDRVSMPGMRDSRAGCRRDRTRRAGRGAGAWRPRRGRPGACPRAGPAGSHRGTGQAGRHAGRAGSLAADNRAASARRSRCARGHGPAPAEPWTAGQQAVTGSRAGPGHAPAARVLAPAAPAGRAGQAPAAGQPASQPYRSRPPRVP